MKFWLGFIFILLMLPVILGLLFSWTFIVAKFFFDLGT